MKSTRKSVAEKKKITTTELALGGMLAALVFVATSFLKLPISMTNGYIHLGDGFILLGALLLGYLAIPAAAIGSMLADLMLGYVTYALPTLIIKGLVALIAVYAARRRSLGIRILVLALAEAFMIAGYFLMEWLFMGYGLAAAAGSIPGNIAQGISGVIIAVLLFPMLRRIKLPKG